MTASHPAHPHRLLLGAAAGIALGAMGPSHSSVAAGNEPPARLSDTGLYAPGSTTQIRAGTVAFTPQYALWSDAADKRRWLRLPAGQAIDASNADAWVFPIGTQL